MQQGNQEDFISSHLASLLGSMCISSMQTIGSNSSMQQQDTSSSQHTKSTPQSSSMQYASIGEHEESYVCQRCFGVVSVGRKQAHDTVWCSALSTTCTSWTNESHHGTDMMDPG